MNYFWSTIVCGALFCGATFACQNPEVSLESFTTQDATIVANIAYIGTFSVKCSSGTVGSLYAEVDGNIAPVSVIESNKYQVSWTEDIKSARTGDQLVRIFNEDGYTAYRKATRAEEDPSSVPAFAEISVNHPGAFNGPWLKSEFLAAVLSVVVAYVAISSKSQLTS